MKLYRKLLFTFFNCIICTSFSLAQNNYPDSINIDETSFHYLDTKFKLEYKSEEQQFEAKVKLRMRKDSIIWVSLGNSTGIEGLRVLITKDSVFIIDRLNKDYVYYDFKQISEIFKFELNFDMLQSLIIGNMPFKSFDKTKARKDNEVWLVKQKEKQINIDNYINAENRKLQELLLVDENTHNSLKLIYQDFIPYGENGDLFPHKSFITLRYRNTDKLKDLNTSITIQHLKIIIGNEPVAFPFNIPGKFGSGVEGGD